MKNARTKQQVACDGVKTAWQNDTFTEILQQQVTTQFFMDGVKPNNEGLAVESITPKRVKERKATVEEIHEQREKVLVGVMDGIRIPWKKKLSTI